MIKGRLSLVSSNLFLILILLLYNCIPEELSSFSRFSGNCKGVSHKDSSFM